MNRRRWRRDSNGNPHIFGHARLRYGTDDMTRYRPFNVGIAALTSSKSISVQKLFLLPALMTAIFNFGCRPVSDHVLSATSESGVVDNVGVAVETASPSFSSKVIFACLYFPHVDFRVLSRHFGTSGQSKREAMTSYCRALIQVIGLK